MFGRRHVSREEEERARELARIMLSEKRRVNWQGPSKSARYLIVFAAAALLAAYAKIHQLWHGGY